MKKAMVLLVLFAVVCAFACACAEQDTFFSFGAPEPESGASPDAATSHPWTYPIARDLLEDPSGVIRLINRDNLLDKDYPPKDQLVATKVRKTSSTKWLVRDVMALPLETMFGAAEAEGIRLYVESGTATIQRKKRCTITGLKRTKASTMGMFSFLARPSISRDFA